MYFTRGLLSLTSLRAQKDHDPVSYIIYVSVVREKENASGGELVDSSTPSDDHSL